MHEQKVLNSSLEWRVIAIAIVHYCHSIIAKSSYGFLVGVGLKVPTHESYTQRRVPACLHQEKMPPFPLALGFKAAISPRSRVAKSPVQFTVW